MSGAALLTPDGSPNVGDFVRVRADHDDPSRVGKDGQVMALQGPEVALYFGTDRYNRSQNVWCAGPEAWAISDLDLSKH